MAEKDDWVVTIDQEEMAEKDDNWVKPEHESLRASVCLVWAFPSWQGRFDADGKAQAPRLLHFLKRSNAPLESYVRSLAEVAQILKDSYESLDPAWERDTNRFLRLMILDGCFMLELLRNYTQTVNDYADNDPIFSSHGKLHIVPYIRRDMLMLENQLPMLVLTTLLAVGNEETKEDEEFVNKLILKFCCRTRFPLHSRMGKCLHLFDVHRKILLWEDTSSETKRDDGGGDKGQKDKKGKTDSEASAGGDENIRSAMELNEAGIIFRKSQSQSLEDISFEGGKLTLPLIVVEDTTESIINHSAKDVSLLHDKVIIQNAIGSDKAVAELFNSISKDSTLDPDSSLDRVHKKVDWYCKRPWNNWRLNLYNLYFAFLATRPWWKFCVTLALVLLALALLQTEEMAGKDDWMVTVKEELKRMAPSATIGAAEEPNWDKRSIYRVPASIVTDLNIKAYKPQFVSFGPYHHGKDHLMPMEKHKHRALLHFLKRSNKPLESYVNSLAEVAQSLKDSYESLDPVWESNTNRFVQMMIVDGCFMIEVLRNFKEATNDYADSDPIFSNHGKLHIVPYIRRDMLMLENQLPMLLLTTLLEVEKEETKNDDEYVNKLILKFCCRNGFPLDSSMGKCLHLLDVHRKILLWEDTNGGGDKGQKDKKGKTDSKASAGGEEIIRSAMELNEAGINFRKSRTQSLKDISFEGGKLTLPLIVVEDTTESMFLNLIAFERFHVGVGNAVTSYVFIMDSIIDSARDVSLLHDEGIIQNALGSDKAVAALFNSISKDATLDPASSLDLVHKKVDKYCKKRRHKWRAYAKHTYFRNPWAIISVIAAIVLFTLTILQTIYTMLSYYDPQS
ncbi:hypothetical protein RHSIM_Rhsim12G0117000 [Rhododendron simsii]|uniref:Uncharacterized protein n=1 Tax=Rhododendron simsii TaxID=118357 RepID=A0A834L9J3_RHOSS|nr:hypothetical protein RHSIM_Rhsim12G0117000 [Rhododendron simsii]